MKILLILLAATMILWDGFWWLLGVPPLFPWQLKQILREQPDTVLLDVRTRWEYDWYHIPAARSVSDPSKVADALTPEDQNRRLVIICMTGHRSPVVAYQLKKRGYEQVRNLTWGTLGWLLYLNLEKLLPSIGPEKSTRL